MQVSQQPSATTATFAGSARRMRATIRGVVQGVGFRPFVFRLAEELRIAGFVHNTSSGVVIEAEGPQDSLAVLMERLRRDPPPLARIDSVKIDDLALCGDEGFSIIGSVPGSSDFAPIPPDVAMCEDCEREIADPADRRYRYPFTNCTNCGPRFTIIRDLPYDRASTAMEAFRMCARCETEYRNPADRRFHAEPIACADCGPRLDSSIDETGRRLRGGEIVAIKGLGGFHLACDARNDDSVRALRLRKRRSDKPFALMVRDLEVAGRLCILSDADRDLLASRERPIVIVPRRHDSGLSDAVAPGNSTCGVMLPYTPLHHLLFSDHIDALVMTSGNISDEPIVISNANAQDRLAGIADFFLLHDRDIHVRVDDSVARVMEGKPRLLRRSRSWAPHPIDIGLSMPELLACGAELKNTLCLTRDRFAILSQHIGDLSNYETLSYFEETFAHLTKLFRVTPRAVAHDLHPLYMSTRFAHRCGLPSIGVQHHHAHIASCMAENGIRDRVIGVAMDGTGYGVDGKIWGGEFLVCDLAGFERRAHLRNVPLAGGDAAIRQPWRSAVSYLRDAGLNVELPVPAKERSLVEQMLDRQINVFETSSCGRLFDAVASILGVRQEITFEAQAAIDLEMIADPTVTASYPFEITGEEIDMRPAIAAMVKDRDVRVAAAKFHNTLRDMIAETCTRIRHQDHLNRVCLSGGVFQNALLLSGTAARLRERGFEVVLHSRVPPNDGGIALGQAVIAAERLRGGEC
jgi:hydrogenase maturation protein HypF